MNHLKRNVKIHETETKKNDWNFDRLDAVGEKKIITDKKIKEKENNGNEERKK